MRTVPLPPQRSHGVTIVPGRGTAALAGLALRQAIEDDLARRAGERLFERDLEIVAQIRAALGTGCAAFARPRTSPKNMSKMSPNAPAAKAEVAHARCAVADDAEAIVMRALIRIGEHFVGLVDLFEAMLGLGLVVGDVGVMRARERTIGSLDLVPRCAARDAEDFVVIRRGHVSQRAC